MTNWRKQIPLKDILGDDESDEAACTAAAEVAKRLKDEPEYTTDSQLVTIVTELEEIAQDGSICEVALRGRYGRYTLCRWFNDVLNDLYDWADNERVWIS